MKNLNNSKGITLIALVITIIVILIISSITISLSSNFYEHAQKASFEFLKSSYLESLEICKLNVRTQTDLSKISNKEFMDMCQTEIEVNENFVQAEITRINDDIIRVVTKEGYVFQVSLNYTKYLYQKEDMETPEPEVFIEFMNFENDIFILPGETKDIDFSVKNYSDTNVNRILLDYYMDIDFTVREFDITYTLYDITDGQQVQLTKSQDGYGPISLSNNGRQERHYRLVLSWNKDDNNISNAGKICKCSIGINGTKEYDRMLAYNEVEIKSYGCTLLSATAMRLGEDENRFKVTIENSNPYDVTCKISGNKSFIVTYNGESDETEIKIQANSSKVLEVNFESQFNELYVDAKRDSNGKIYTLFDMFVNASQPYNGNDRKIAEGLKIYLLESAKSILVANADEIHEYQEGEKFTGPSGINEGDLCSIKDPVSGKIEYFYRGNISNNYIKFAGKLWRILRINDDGSLRLILDNTIGTDSSYADSNTSSGNSVNEAIKLLDWKSSNVYSQLSTWYNSNIGNNVSYSHYIVPTKFTFETGYTYSQSSSTNNTVYYFNSYIRIGGDGNTFKPTFSYSDDTLIEDKFGLITADEIVYAGGYWGEDNKNYFLYNSDIKKDCWTMSPSFWDNNTKKAGMLILTTVGKISDWPSSGNTLTESLGIRPVVSISSDITLSGNGTISNPYQIE